MDLRWYSLITKWLKSSLSFSIWLKIIGRPQHLNQVFSCLGNQFLHSYVIKIWQLLITRLPTICKKTLQDSKATILLLSLEFRPSFQSRRYFLHRILPYSKIIFISPRFIRFRLLFYSRTHHFNFIHFFLPYFLIWVYFHLLRCHFHSLRIIFYHFLDLLLFILTSFHLILWVDFMTN